MELLTFFSLMTSFTFFDKNTYEKCQFLFKKLFSKKEVGELLMVVLKYRKLKTIFHSFPRIARFFPLTFKTFSIKLFR